jgi:Dynamin family
VLTELVSLLQEELGRYSRRRRQQSLRTNTTRAINNVLSVNRRPTSFLFPTCFVVNDETYAVGRHQCLRRWLSSSSSSYSSNNALENTTLSDMTSSFLSSSSSSPEVILEECAVLYDSLVVLNNKLGGMAIPPSSDRATSMPFCLLVGNHSSGKSSFINYVLQRNIQKAGVAPTDDTFTVIAPGPKDTDADGPTLVGDPDLGFASLRQFGPTLIHHTQLKNRTSRLNFMLVSIVLYCRNVNG